MSRQRAVEASRAGRRIGAACVCLLLTARAGPSLAEPLRAELDVAFTGSSTLHDFGGSAAPVTVTVAPEPEAPGHWRADVEVPVASLDTGIGMRDEGMRAMLDAARFPVVRGTLRDVDAAAVERTRRLPFVLTIRDVARPTTAVISDWRETDDRLTFEASFDVSLAAFGLAAPGVLFIRVADRVDVTVRVNVRRA